MVLDTASRVSEEAKEALEAERSAPEVAEAHEPAPLERAGTILTPQVVDGMRKVVPVLWLVAAVVAGFLWGVQLVLLVLAAGAAFITACCVAWLARPHAVPARRV